MRESEYFKSIAEVYREISDNRNRKGEALSLLRLRHWYNQIANFDPRTAEATPQSLIDIFEKIKAVNKKSPPELLDDRVTRITDHIKDALLKIFAQLKTRVLREHVMMPVYAVRELDSASIQWLSRQTGRNIREKLASRPYLKAVKRRMSIDTAENRLLKAFCIRYEEILHLQNECFEYTSNYDSFHILEVVERWLRDPITKEIGSWNNLAPNNTLLQHRNYRKIWDAWRCLQNLDKDMQKDHRRMLKDWSLVLLWTIASKLYFHGNLHALQQPCHFDYDRFSLSPELTNISGLFFRLTPKGKSSGIVEKLNKDKNGRDYGFLHSLNGERLFFHSTDFCNRIDFDGVQQNSVLFFDIQQGSKGPIASKLSAFAPSDIKLSLDRDKISIKIAEECHEIYVCDESSQRGKVTVTTGRHSWSIALDYRGAEKTAEWILGKVLQVKSGVPVFTPSKTRPKNEFAAIDLSTVRPEFVDNESGKSSQLPFRLLIQYWQTNQGSLLVDLKECNAAVLRSDVATVGILDLLAESPDIEPALSSAAAMEFAKEMADFVNAEELTYLVPDIVDDFSLERIRRAMNFHFKKAQPLPRSIGTVFAWQDLDRPDIREGDCIVVLDCSVERLCLTPLIACCDEALQHITEGIFWERHPRIDLGKEMSSMDLAIKILQKSQCAFPHPVGKTLGFQGIFDAFCPMSWKDEKGNWFSLPYRLKTENGQMQPGKNIANVDNLQKILPCRPNARIYVLTIGDIPADILSKIAKKLFQGMKTVLPKHIGSPISGVGCLQKRQKMAKENPLWKDHLPELSMRVIRDGSYDTFDLVKNIAITPRRGHSEIIEIRESFDLPAGSPHYRFPLIQGTEGRELRYQAYLKSPAFPLEKDVNVKLELTYSYGSDDPYELLFLPIAKDIAGFKSVRAQWKQSERKQKMDSISPSFPRQDSWEDFSQFPRENGKLDDLIKWVSKNIKYMNERYEVFRHYRFDDIDRLKGFIEDIRKALRFPMLTIWNHGHSLQDSDAPEGFREKIQAGCKTCMELQNIPEQYGNSEEEKKSLQNLADEALFFLCCLQKDMPEGAVNRLNSVFDKSFRDYYRYTAFAIGNAELKWQRKLLAKIFALVVDRNGLKRSVSLQSLAIALWRSKALLHCIDKDKMEDILDELRGCLEFDLKGINTGKNNYQKLSLVHHLELLLALLRTRESKKEEIKDLLAPDSERAKEFSYLVEKITKKICNSNLRFTPRVEIKVKKPECLGKTPDLLYALTLYLTGDNGANAIHITGVRDGE